MNLPDDCELTFKAAAAYAVYNVLSCKNEKNNHW